MGAQDKDFQLVALGTFVRDVQNADGDPSNGSHSNIEKCG